MNGHACSKPGGTAISVESKRRRPPPSGRRSGEAPALRRSGIRHASGTATVLRAHRADWLHRTLALAIVLCSAALAVAAWQQPRIFTSLPAHDLLAGAVALAVGMACACQSYVHTLRPERDFVRHNEVGGFTLNVVGSLYAVLLGFLTVSTWQHFADARQLVAQEAAAAADAWHMAADLPSVRRSKIRRDVLDYANLMVSNEWPAMRSGGFDARADRIVMDAIIQAGELKPADSGVANAQTASLQQLGVVHDLRQRRLDDNASGIAPFEWLVLLIGAACVISLCWFFGVTNQGAHLLMTSCVVIIITSLLVLLFELQYPFRSSLGIPPDSWRAVIQHIAVMQAGAQMDMRM